MVVPELLDENGLLPVPSASDDVPFVLVGPTDRACPSRRLMADNFTPKVKEILRAGGCRFVWVRVTRP